MPIVTRNDPLSGVESKVFSGERLSLADGLALLESPDLMRIGHLADRERKRIVGDSVYFNCNRHINYTNICRNRCDFCAFSRDVGEEGAFTLRPEEILEKASEALDYGVTELHIVGGEHPDLPYEEVRRMIVDLHAFAPGVHLKAFTVSEIAHFAASTGMGEEEVLLDLKEAGLGSLPGGGAEIFAERVRSQVCSRKISGERWLEIHKLAHRCGLRSNATMLYGHVDSPEDRVDHLIRLREAQDETGGFQAFIPLVFHPANTKLSHIAPPTGVEILKMVALSRLMLDNFLHIKSYWIQTGIKLAQISLFFGANDVDGTVVEETITRMAGSDSGVAVSREELVRIIEDAGRVPVERDTLYRPLRRYGA